MTASGVTTRISELSSIIASTTSKYDNYLSTQALPTPSFDPGAPPFLPLPSDMAEAKQILLEATDELHALIAGPLGTLFTPYHNHLISLQAINRFEIAKSFDFEATYEDIARSCGLAEFDIRRLIRTSMTYHIFHEPRPGVVAHTAASKFLAVAPGMEDSIALITEENWTSAAKVVDAMVKWPGSQEPNQAGFQLANGTSDSLFACLAKDPARAARFSKAMANLAQDPGFSPEHICQNYPWAKLETATVVDVGGSSGTFGIALAEHFPKLKIIVQDRPDVVQVASKQLPGPLKQQVSFMAHDFFTKQPVKDADVYFFKWIFHDWSDKYAIQILRSLIPALKKGAKIVLNEYVIPQPGEVSFLKEREIRAYDLTMLEMLNAKERERADWEKLFNDADPGFQVLSIKQPPAAKLGIVEAQWVGAEELNGFHGPFESSSPRISYSTK